MTDEVELGPDANQIRRHAKKMLTELEYRRRYRRVDFYEPNKAQLEFHNIIAREVAVRAGNQLGKTTCISVQMTFDALGRYPEWYQGFRHQTPKIERPYDFIGWAASTTSVTTRDGVQTKLFGDVRQSGGYGSGLVPLDNLCGDRPTMARGVSDFVDTATLRRETGGTAIIRFKTHEMARSAFQGESVDTILIDEDPENDYVYGECLARLTATDGRIFFACTPMPGKTDIWKRFLERVPGTAICQMRLVDATHIPVERHAEIRAKYPVRERATRVDGEFAMGAGCVFLFPEDSFTYTQDPKSFPQQWRWMWAVDFSHGGMAESAHPFAAVLGCYDPIADTIYIVHALKLFRMLPQQHVAIMQKHPCWDALVALPHDGNNAVFGSTVTIRKRYKDLGLNMRATHAVMPGTNKPNFEDSLRLIEERLATGRLKVASHLGEWFDEYRNYHYQDGKVVKEDDDLMSATRILCMDISHAQELSPQPGTPGFWRDPPAYRQQSQPRYAKGTEMNQPFDLFTGRKFCT